MQDLFSSAPVIGRNARQGLYVEADPVELEPERDQELQRLAIAYGHLLGKGSRLTGAQWIRQIATHHGQRPGVGRHMDYIRRAMLVDQFQDDWLLISGNGAPTLRATAALCEVHRAAGGGVLVPVAECSGLQVEQAALHMASAQLLEHGARIAGVDDPLRDGHRRLDAHFLGLANHEAYRVHAPPGRLAAALSLLDHPCVGVETFSDEQNADDAAACEAMAALTRHLGYTSFVTAKPPGSALSRGAQAPVQRALDAQIVASKLEGFVAEMVQHGWDPAKPVFLCRPAPVVNPAAAVRPFESILTERLIAWRLPRAVVQRVVQRIKAGQAEAESIPRSAYERQ